MDRSSSTRHEFIKQDFAGIDESNQNQFSQKDRINFVPMMPIQHFILQERAFVNPHYDNFASLFKVHQALHRVQLEETIKYLLRYHDVLRSHFTIGSTGWQQFIPEPNDHNPFTWVDLSNIPEKEHMVFIQSQAVRNQASLNLFTGHVIQITYFDPGNQKPGYLLMIMHHLITDAYSQSILFQDFEKIYGQLTQGKHVSLPPKTTSVKVWGERLKEYAQTPELRKELDNYWLKLPWNKLMPLPNDCIEESRRYIYRYDDGIAAHQTFLSIKETTILQKYALNTKVSILEILLTVLVQTFKRWSGSSLLHIGVLNHGRMVPYKDINLLRTVGFLVEQRCLLLELQKTVDIKDAVQQIKAQLLNIPNNGADYMILRYLCDDPSVVAKLKYLPSLTQVVLNYQGHIRNKPEQVAFPFFTPMEGIDIGPLQDPSNGERNPGIGCHAVIKRGQFFVRFEALKKRYSHTVLETLAQIFIKFLQELIM